MVKQLRTKMQISNWRLAYRSRLRSATLVGISIVCCARFAWEGPLIAAFNVGSSDSAGRSLVWHHVLSLSTVESGVHADVAHFTTIVVPEKSPQADTPKASKQFADAQEKEAPVPHEWLEETLVSFYL